MVTKSFLQRWSRCKRHNESESKKEQQLTDSTKYLILDGNDCAEIADSPIDNLAAENELIDSPENNVVTEQSLSDDDAVVLTMGDVEQLKDGDSVAGFLLKGVSSEIKKAALCKLFQCDSYNVLDGLNDYDLDYSNKKNMTAAVVATVRQWTQHKVDEGKQSTVELLQLKNTAAQPEPNTQPQRQSQPILAPADSAISNQSLPEIAATAPYLSENTLAKITKKDVKTINNQDNDVEKLWVDENRKTISGIKPDIDNNA